VRVTANTSRSLGILLANCTSGRYPQLSNAAFSSRRQVSQSRPPAVLFAALLWASCASLAGAQERVLQSEGWNAGLRLTETVDLNSDPRVVEINLEARVARVEIAPDRHVEAWTYDGGLPGPLIRVRVGDRLIVHFSNRLPTPTTVHWHGIRLPNRMDGVPGHSQPEVQPAESFTYDFVVPDAGLFWYHPHVMSAAQVGFGLYGALLVEDPSERVGTADELVLVLSDIEIRGDGTLESPDTGASTGMAFGREGNHLLVNGRIGGELLARSGAPQRWRIINAAKSRYFQLDVDGPLFTDGQLFTIIGGDGGLLEHPVKRDRLVLAPGERTDAIVIPRAAPGAELVVRSLLYNRGYGSVEARTPFDDLFTITMAELPPYAGGPLPETRRSIEPLSTSGATTIDIQLTLGQLRDGSFEYRINGEPFARDKPVQAMPGETQVWTVTNKTKWSHPFHLHGFFFQVLDENGSPVRPLAWKDTVDVPFEQTARFVVRFDDRPGGWMYHCHVLDHADGGLMGIVQVGAPDPNHSHHRKP
jgi:FtsP/CotA-like multicopper oxidase with cupredoxin domain